MQLVYLMELVCYKKMSVTGLLWSISRIFKAFSTGSDHTHFPEDKSMQQERRHGARHVVSFPIRVKWKDEDGQVVIEEGLTENVGPSGTLIYLPRKLPTVGSNVEITVTENPDNEVTVTAQVIRLERNAAHPQVALNLTKGMQIWKKGVWSLAAEVVADQDPDDDDW